MNFALSPIRFCGQFLTAANLLGEPLFKCFLMLDAISFDNHCYSPRSRRKTLMAQEGHSPRSYKTVVIHEDWLLGAHTSLQQNVR